MKRWKKLNRPTVVPPGGFTTTLPDFSGETLTGNSLDDLVRKANQLYRANGQEPPPNLRPTLETQICDRLPINWYTEFPWPNAAARHPKPATSDYQRDSRGKYAKPTLNDVGRGMRVYFAAVLGRVTYVPRPVAVARAQACKNCPLNVDSTACATCSSLYQHMVRAIGQQKIDDVQRSVHPRKLRVCLTCKCLNAAKVWLDKKALETVVTQKHLDDYKERAPHCWLLKEFPEGLKK